MNKMIESHQGRSAKSSKNDSQGMLEKISQHLKLGIRSGRFVPGQHLLESDLTHQLGCSRGSLRPAMIHLAADGIITINRFKGARISVLSRKCIVDLLDVLQTLVTFMAERACARVDIENNRALLEKAISALKDTVKKGDNVDYLQKREDFYDALIAASGNSELHRIVPLLRADLLKVQMQIMEGGSAKVIHIKDYEDIAEAILAGNFKKAEKCISKHFQRTRDSVEKIPDALFPRAD
ncbi:MAG: GntR family transcriptional regulator [Porticoccaceae bacterium]